MSDPTPDQSTASPTKSLRDLNSDVLPRPISPPLQVDKWTNGLYDRGSGYSLSFSSRSKKAPRWKLYDVNLPTGWAAADKWPPSYVLLSDHVVGKLLDLHMNRMISGLELGRRWPADFTPNGCIRLTRVHNGDPYILPNTNQIGIFADTYPLHGRYEFPYAGYIGHGKCTTYYMRQKMDRLRSKGVWWKQGPELDFVPTTDVDLEIMNQLPNPASSVHSTESQDASIQDARTAAVIEGTETDSGSSTASVDKLRKRPLRDPNSELANLRRKRLYIDLEAPVQDCESLAEGFSSERASQHSEVLDSSTEKRLRDVQSDVTPYLEPPKRKTSTDDNHAVDPNPTSLEKESDSLLPEMRSVSSLSDRREIQRVGDEAVYENRLDIEQSTSPPSMGKELALTEGLTRDRERHKRPGSGEIRADSLCKWIESILTAPVVSVGEDTIIRDLQPPDPHYLRWSEINRISKDPEANTDARILLDHIAVLQYSLRRLRNDQAGNLQSEYSGTDRLAQLQSDYDAKTAELSELKEDMIRKTTRVRQSLRLEIDRAFDQDLFGGLDVGRETHTGIESIQPSFQAHRLQRMTAPIGPETPQSLSRKDHVEFISAPSDGNEHCITPIDKRVLLKHTRQ